MEIGASQYLERSKKSEAPRPKIWSGCLTGLHAGPVLAATFSSESGEYCHISKPQSRAVTFLASTILLSTGASHIVFHERSAPQRPNFLPLQSAGGSATMGREDQIEEREVLDSIFPDEITGMLQTNFAGGAKSYSFSFTNKKLITRHIRKLIPSINHPRQP